MQISYDFIQPLLVSSVIEGDVMTCHFQVPGGGSTIESTSRVGEPVSGLPTQEDRKGGALDTLRKAAAYTISRIFDRSSSEPSRGQASPAPQEYTEAQKQAAVLEAFKKIANQFVYDKSRRTWEYRSRLTAYELQLAQQPVETEYDRIILERLLVELAPAHDDINEQEEAFLEDLLGADEQKLQLLQQQTPVTKPEAEAVTEAVRPTIYMLVYTIAAVDHHLDDQELELLHAIAQNFGFTPQVEEMLSTAAKHHVFENDAQHGFYFGGVA